METDIKEYVLVTGAAGFIGSHICDELLHLGYRVVALDDLSGGFHENIPGKAEFIKGNICDETLICELFDSYKFSYIFHFAAYAAEGLSHFIRNFNYRNNLLGSVNLINAAVNSGCVKCFVFASSIAVYGKNQLPMTEDMMPSPEDPYGIAKLAVEMDLRSAHEMFGQNFIIFRPHNVYGERQNISDPYRNVVGIFMNQVLGGKALTVFGDGLQTRAFSHIDDVAPLIAKSIEMPECYNQVFNIGADKPYTVKELATIICREFGVAEKLKFLEARNEVVNAYSDHSKIQKYFRHLMRNISLEEGVRRMAAHVKQGGSRELKKFECIEIKKRIPAIWTKLM